MTKEIICEAGVSWYNLEQAKEHITLAKQVNANAVKFQLFTLNEAKNSNKWSKHLEKTHILESDAKELMQHAKKTKIELFFTPMWLSYVDLCEELGVKRYKIRRSDAYWDKLILRIQETGKPCYVSRNDKDRLDPIKQKNFFTLYYDKDRPTKLSDVIAGYSNILVSDGYSCHCDKLYSVLWLMMVGGMDYIEVHTRLHNNPDLPDNDYSFSYADVREMCRYRDMINNTVNKGVRGKYELV